VKPPTRDAFLVYMGYDLGAIATAAAVWMGVPPMLVIVVAVLCMVVTIVRVRIGVRRGTVAR
jgi:fatty acid desaturase